MSRARPGWVPERSIGHAWKACVPQGTEGSNPSPSAIPISFTMDAFVGQQEGDRIKKHAVLRRRDQTLYRHVSPEGSLREDGRKLLKTKRR